MRNYYATMRTLLFIFLLACSFHVNAQSGREQMTVQYPIVQLLGVEYEIKDIPEPDHDRLLQIPYAEISSHRLHDVNVEIFDPVSNYTIVLYSDVLCQQNKQ